MSAWWNDPKTEAQKRREEDERRDEETRRHAEKQADGWGNVNWIWRSNGIEEWLEIHDLDTGEKHNAYYFTPRAGSDNPGDNP